MLMSDKTVLVVDDDTAHATMLRTLMKGWGYAVQVAPDGDDGVDAVTNSPFGLVLMDMKMVKMSGMDALAKIHAFNPALPVIIMTAYSSVDTAVRALKIGAYDYLTKPLDFDKLKLTVDRVFERLYLKNENQDLKKQLETSTFHHDILGKSPVMKALLDTIHMVAPTDANVLVTGESGTGKELVAAALHNNSMRRPHPYIRINCAAITETLLESELFGHERGAFTGADKKRKGKFLLADKGSILLDEIGEMSLAMQAKLLRVIQEKEIAPVGSEQSLAVDVRVIAATNKNIREEIDRNTFREDLYHRLSVIIIHVPTLNERTDDIPVLAEHFNALICGEYGMSKKTIRKDAIAELQKIEWTGNIREFRNVLERLIILCRDEITGADVLAYARPVSGSNIL